MNYKLLMDTAVTAGELMLENGAETYRVEDTMHRILSLSSLQTAEVFVTMTGFVATLDDPSIHSMTVVRRITSRGTNLDMIDRLKMCIRDRHRTVHSLQSTGTQASYPLSGFCAPRLRPALLSSVSGNTGPA